MAEGDMTKRRAQAVREEALDIYAAHLELPSYLYLGRGEELTGGRTRKAVIADAFEAVLGAVFKEFGFDKAYDCLLYTSPSPRDRTRSRMPSSA